VERRDRCRRRLVALEIRFESVEPVLQRHEASPFRLRALILASLDEADHAARGDGKLRGLLRIVQQSSLSKTSTR
jgi:hypothetical protein